MTEATNGTRETMHTSVGDSIYSLCCELFPICRSITGPGVRRTLEIIKTKHIPDLTLHEIPSGTSCFDWAVPDEWLIRDAYIKAPDGTKVVDFRNSNLHVVGYSVPVNCRVSLEELQSHLHSLPSLPTAIPYVTSHYERTWGFCLSHEVRQQLKQGEYHVVIDSELFPGRLTYGELIIPGQSGSEVLLSTYVCHPSMANNEISGPAVTTFVARWLSSRSTLKHTYRIVFVPETIGSIVYLSRNLDTMKRNTIAGFNVTCVGDDKAYSYLPSRDGNTFADKIALHVLRHLHPDFISYSWLDRGSDERQYCSPGIDLPVVTVMRTKYGEYPEYHTSLDDLNFISPAGLGGAFAVLVKCIESIEADTTLKTTVLCEPQMQKRGLYPTLSTGSIGQSVADMMNLLSYCDGKHSLLEIAEKLGLPLWEIEPIASMLHTAGLIDSQGFGTLRAHGRGKRTEA